VSRPEPAPDPRIAERVAEAQRAHARGWLQTPLRGKAPYLKGWQNLPAPTPGMVEAWSLTNNLGVRTGAQSGVVVIDDDTPDRSAATTLGLPPTPTVLTGGGGKHHYYRAPSIPIGNSASKLADKIDVKGENGVVAAAGSIHPETGKPYAWAPGLSPEEIALADLPESIISALTKPKKRRPADKFAPGTPANEKLRNYARAAMRAHVAGLAVAPEGKRNDTLNRSAFVLGRFVGAGLLDRTEVEQALHAAALAAGLEEIEIRGTIRSGIEKGMGEPHDLKTLARKATRTAQDGARIPVDPCADERMRPVITVEGGKLPAIVDAAEQALLEYSGPQIFQRESLLVRMTRSKSLQIDSGIRRPEGALTLTQVEPAFLLEILTAAASFQKFDTRSNSYKSIDCTERVANTYLARKGSWRVPVLRAVVEAPTLRPNGSVLQVPGYDAATGLFFDPGGIEFAPVPERPTQDDALAALGLLHALIEKFPFVELCDRTVALAAMLTALVRRSLRTAPLFAFRAPTMSSGKSLLADLTAMMATGRPVPAMPQGKDEDEDRKRMLALLIEGDAVCCIDNIERPLNSPALCSILTQVTYKDRILGRTGTATVPTCTTWLATGNNLVITGDLITRALVCDLDAKVEHPEERKFSVNLYEYIPDHRHELVPAALTILRAFHLAGRPKQELPVFGRFEGWSDLIRSALVWCGEADPCVTRKRIESIDPVRNQIHALLALWEELIKYETVTAAQVVENSRSGGGESRAALHQALLEAVHCNEAELNPMRLGKWLVRNERRIERGLRVERAGERQGTALWRVVRVSA
jgi:hypothetical protein